MWLLRLTTFWVEEVGLGEVYSRDELPTAVWKEILSVHRVEQLPLLASMCYPHESQIVRLWV